MVAPRRPFRILGVKKHEGLIHSLAKTGHRFDLLVDEPAWDLPWDVAWNARSRPMPDNVRIIGPLAEIGDEAMAGYDVAIVHEARHLERFRWSGVPLIFMPIEAFALPGTVEWTERERTFRSWGLRQQLRDVRVVCLSRYTAESWGLPATIIDPGFDPADYAAYPWEGGERTVLTAANFFARRANTSGYELTRAVVRDDLPLRVVGRDAPPGGYEPASWEELKAAFQRHRVYLHTTPSGHGFALYEAALAGMPIVKTPRLIDPEPFTDGLDAFVSNDPEHLRAGVRALLEDHELARQMGARARQTVIAMYGMDRFVARWTHLLDEAATGGRAAGALAPSGESVGEIRAGIRVLRSPARLHAGESGYALVRLENEGDAVWPCSTRDHLGEVRLSYRWLGRPGQDPYEGVARTPLPADVAPGEVVVLEAEIRAPAEPGSYELEWDLVSELVAWFETPGSAESRTRVTVW
ncbi:MAG: glycosyltransferase [Chloroflexota bacterium]